MIVPVDKTAGAPRFYPSVKVHGLIRGQRLRADEPRTLGEKDNQQKDGNNMRRARRTRMHSSPRFRAGDNIRFGG